MEEARQTADPAQAEKQAVLRALSAAVKLVGGMVDAHTEVVLHDLSRPERSVVAIENGHVSGRRLGDAILGGPAGDRGFAAIEQAMRQGGAEPALVSGYHTLSRDGRRLLSASAVFKTAAGEPFAALCLNSDRSQLEAALACLQALVGRAPPPPRAAPEPPAMDEAMRDIIAQALDDKPLARMKKADKKQAVAQMLEQGLFIVKGGVERAAEALGVSRYTIYNYLDEIRGAAAEDEA
ncbi:putative transcriptional regulator YheO [Chromobacterium alkanivorans]|uniref:helix-turn-helix transcriptional regulator n=1 Tax=Chromobacterium alkanivorans TaxID=1071719 RepID=UPI0021672F8D|nr:PAS domain-containing protein [Chromobacterium alkanivorans]MCS3804581.1 putative transcriptional regulator YheO [Chromobacterium alkanivorans]MCS3818920.1 putative transcriptional regulator YheO [Chromobacterium alkanivorans]MCS3873222.1 putative transcriptional regulator YheO [Chromobacterium alkanivorans]